jgi:hypothetical protein
MTIAPDYYGRVRALEGGRTNPITGASGPYQFLPPTAAQYMSNGQSADQAMTRFTQDNAKSLSMFLNRMPTNQELYLAHQQGAAGAAALLRNASTNAIDALTPAYRGNRNLATQAILNNGGNANMTAGDFVNMWGNRYDNARPIQVAQADTGNANDAQSSALSQLDSDIAAAQGKGGNSSGAKSGGMAGGQQPDILSQIDADAAAARKPREAFPGNPHMGGSGLIQTGPDSDPVPYTSAAAAASSPDAQTQPDRPFDPAHATGIFGSGINQGLADIFGAPVDLFTGAANALARGIGDAGHALGVIPPEHHTGQIQHPFGGSESINEGINAGLNALSGAMGLGSFDSQPQNTPERYIGAAGRGVGNAVGGGGAEALAARGLEGLASIRALTNGGDAAQAAAGRAAASAAEAPTAARTAGLLGRQVAAGAASGVGAQGGHEAAQSIAPGNRWLDMGLSILGGMLGGAAPSIRSAPGALVRSQEGIAGRALNEAAAGGRHNVMDEPPLPGQPTSLGRAMNNSGLMAFENHLNRSSPKDQGVALEDRSAGNQVVRNAMGDIAPGSVNDVEPAVRSAQDAATASMNSRSAGALQRVQDALSAAGVGQGLSRDEAPLVARGELDSALKAARKQESALWNGIDPDNKLSFVTAPLKSDVEGYVNAIPKADQGDVPQDIIGTIGSLGSSEPLSEWLAIPKMLGAKVRQARSVGDWNRARIIGDIGDIVQDRLQSLSLPNDNALEPGEVSAALERYQQARDYSRNFNSLFSRGAVKRTMRIAPAGGPAVAPSQTLAGITQTPEGIGQYLRATGQSDEAVGAVRDYLLRDMEAKTINSGGYLNSAALKKWTQTNGAKLDQIDPALRHRLTNAATQQDALEQIIAENETRREAMEKSAASLFLNAEPQVAIARVLRDPKPAARASELMDSLKNAPDAQDGVRTALIQHLLEKASTRAADLEGEAVLSSGKLDKEIRDNSNAIMRILTREQRAMLAKVQEAARFHARLGRAALENSPTYAHLSGDRYLDLLLGKWPAKIARGVPHAMAGAGAFLGHLSHIPGAEYAGGWFGERLGKGMFNEARNLKSRDAVIEIIKKGIRDPQFGRNLMMKASPGATKMAGPRFRALARSAMIGALLARDAQRGHN